MSGTRPAGFIRPEGRFFPLNKRAALKKGSDLFIKLFVIFSIAILCAFPQKTTEWASEGLGACVSSVIPSLFPFFVLSSLFIDLGLTQGVGRILCRPLKFVFNLPGACAVPFALGILCGYPSGARAAGELYEKRLCTKAQAEHLLSFCNNSGPAFILGVVGAGLLQNKSLGVFLYVVHVASSLATGLFFRYALGGGKPSGRTQKEEPFTPLPVGEALLSAVRRALDNILFISALVVFFFVICNLLSFAGFFDLFGAILSRLPGVNLSSDAVYSLLKGFFEITAGSYAAASSGMPLLEKCVALSVILGWSGISVHFQTAAVLKGKGLSLTPCILGKLLQGVLAGVLTHALFPLFNFQALPAFAPANPAALSRELNLYLFFIALLLFLLSAVRLSSRGPRRKKTYRKAK